MFSVRQPFPLLIAARRFLNDEDFEILMRVLVHISFRYNVIGSQQTSEQERVYSGAAEKISRAEFENVKQLIEALRPVYPVDKAFKAAFSEIVIRTKSSRNRRIVRYILCALERQKTQLDYDFDSDSFNIEHVLPENPGDHWSQFTDEEAEAYVYRLGNMTLLNTGQNRDLQNANYVTKREVYRASNFHISRKIAEDSAEWTPERIAARQAAMANVASGIWRVTQLS